MADRDMVIKSIENCLHNKDCEDCCYEGCIHAHGNCIGDLMAHALELLKEQPKQQFFVDSTGKITPIQPQWISVKDRMPDAAGYECLVCAVNENYNQTHVFTAHTGYGEPGWWTGNVHYMSRVTSPSDNRLHPALNVTHWMPLPEPPKEESDD